jgi:aryl-alcohol dehydrogenase-like predicted oxidoreductase
MQYTTLGRTGLKVSRISLGGAFVASHTAEREEARRVVRRAIDLGLNYIDTAPTYGDSEEALGYALKGVAEPSRKQFKALYRFAGQCGIALPELAMRFVISNPDIHTVLTGARSVAELEQNVAAAAVHLPDEGQLRGAVDVRADSSKEAFEPPSWGRAVFE